jgi:hypothetical protein
MLSGRTKKRDAHCSLRIESDHCGRAIVLFAPLISPAE